MRKTLVAGNWKMNASQAKTRELLTSLIQETDLPSQLLVCPPHPYLSLAGELLAGSNIALGAQDCAATSEGAYTGEVAASMLADLGVTHVLLGHSERRQHQQESNQLVLAKAKQALAAGIKPVICVGETLEQREARLTEEVVLEQVKALLDGLQLDELSQLIFAYEPVWAIGSGLTASPDQAQAVHALIRQALAQRDPQLADHLQLLYGGSVKPDNAAALFSMPDIDGGLIGGASLDVKQFIAIARAASSS